MLFELVVWALRGEKKKTFLLPNTLARLLCLLDANRKLDATDLILKSINIISKTLPQRSIFVLRDMKPSPFSFRCGEITLREQFGFTPAPLSDRNVSFSYYPIKKKK